MILKNTKSDSPITDVVYNEGNHVLTVTFRETGKYVYKKVAPAHAHGFNGEGVSFGKHFNGVIRPNYKPEPR